MINEDQINAVQVNAFGISRRGCQGVTLAELRQRLRNELSGYHEGSLISNAEFNDVERQFINDGISMLWPHDWETVMYAVESPRTNAKYQTRYYLPDDAEHVLAVYSASSDINNNDVQLTQLTHHDNWMFDRAFIDATTSNLQSGEPWIDAPRKTVQMLVPPCGRYLVVRYARKWKPLIEEDDCIDPQPNRINCIIFYACAQYFISQFQVNTESIRYRNYQSLATNFVQLFQANLIKDSKPLYIV